MKDSKIEWTDHTVNLWHGCTKVHAGCDNCYAERLSHRWGEDIWGNDKPRKEVGSSWRHLDAMQNAAKKAGVKHRVFVGSMMDIFEKPMPYIDSSSKEINTRFDTSAMRHRLFFEITTGKYPDLIFLFLTKRPSNINKYIPDRWKTDPPKNVWFGTSPVDQETADRLVPQLLQVRGNKFLSVEPQLGPVVMDPHWMIGSSGYQGHIDWVIQGGESGPGRRPFDIKWAEMLRQQCQQFQTAYFFKQIDKVIPVPQEFINDKQLPF